MSKRTTTTETVRYNDRNEVVERVIVTETEEFEEKQGPAPTGEKSAAPPPYGIPAVYPYPQPWIGPQAGPYTVGSAPRHV